MQNPAFYTAEFRAGVGAEWDFWTTVFRTAFRTAHKHCMATISYARVSTSDQSTDSQLPDLDAVGAERHFEDVCSGSVPPLTRPGFSELLRFARPGDEVVAWRLDRVARSVRGLLELVEELDQRGIVLRTLRDGVTTAGQAGRLLLVILGVVAEWDRASIRERVQAGVEARRAKGLPLGRPKSLTPAQVQLAQRLRDAGDSCAEVARQIGTSKSTVVRATQGPAS
ncbi:recombinase family protein [Microbacterium sp. NPDC055683]